MDKARFTAAARRYQNMVYRTALHALGSPQDADDAVQEVFLRLFRCGEAFDGEEHLRRWLLRVAVNCCRDALKAPGGSAGSPGRRSRRFRCSTARSRRRCTRR